MWNLNTKVVLITGATNGIGKAAALALAKESPRLVLTYRNQDLMDALSEEIKAVSPNISIQAEYCDFSDQSSIRKCAQTIASSNQVIDVLINNAGVVNTSYRETSDKIENTFAVNHIGYFLFTNLLLPNIEKNSEARIINVSSAAHSFVKEINWDDINLKNDFGMGVSAYGQSKLANLMFTRYLATKLSASGVTVNAIHPGGVNTALGNQNQSMFGKALKLMLKPFFRSPLKGALSIIYLATREDSSDTGEYFVDWKIAKSSSYSKDLGEAQKLWELSEELVGEKFTL